MEGVSSDNVENIISEIAAKGQKLATNGSGVREDIISKAWSLIAALETPMETLLRTIWAEPTRYTAIRLAIEMKVFETLAESGSAKTVSELCVPTSADPSLVARIVRHLAATGIVCEDRTGTYTSTTFSKALALPSYAGGVKFCFDSALPVYASMPSYFTENGYKNPTGPTDGPFKHAHGMDQAFIWLHQHPDIMAAFQAYIYAQRSQRPSWMDEGFYPVHDRLINGMDMDTEGDSSVLVDVGGGVGSCLEEFRVKVPQWKGRLVLQEQESVAKQAVGLDAQIEVMAYDFFTPQPIKGARAYYLRNILHDWPDDRCRDILHQLNSAMKPGYSKILLNECVITDCEASWQHTSLDMYMMALAGAQERTDSQWRELIASAGLKVAGIWSKGEGNESLIEVVN